MSAKETFPFRGTGWRSRFARFASALVATALASALAAAAVWTLQSDSGQGLALGLAGLAVFVGWEALLSITDALVSTADLSLAEESLTVSMAGHWQAQIPRAAIRICLATEVIYRPARARRGKSWLSVTHPTATLIPVQSIEGFTFPLRLAAQMYVGRAAGYGFLVTPDHERGSELLDQLATSL
jgi:hypothetical protein